MSLHSVSGTASTASTVSSLTSQSHLKKLFLIVPTSVSEFELHVFAQQFSPVRMVHILKDRETQRSRGIAFITFEQHEGAQEAMDQMEGRVLEGLILHPQWATPKKRDQATTTPTRPKKRSGSRRNKKKA